MPESLVCTFGEVQGEETNFAQGKTARGSTNNIKLLWVLCKISPFSIDRSDSPTLGIECRKHVHKPDCKTFCKCTENVMCLLFWAFNRKHMYILQSRNEFS